MLKIVLLGPPGSGKGTQAELLCKKFFLKHISTGELLRKAILLETDLGLQAKVLINTGKLVSDGIIINLVKDSIAAATYENNYNGLVLDGFPRNLTQAKALTKDLSVDWIIYLNLSDEVIINRLAGRRYHPTSGRVYHLEYNPPKNFGVDDITGDPLVIRTDDQEIIIKERLAIYHHDTAQIINCYKKTYKERFIEIDGSCNQIDIFNKILNYIESTPEILN